VDPTFLGHGSLSASRPRRFNPGRWVPRTVWTLLSREESCSARDRTRAWARSHMHSDYVTPATARQLPARCHNPRNHDIAFTCNFVAKMYLCRARCISFCNNAFVPIPPTIVRNVEKSKRFRRSCKQKNK
jgi:hypothetical protein